MNNLLFGLMKSMPKRWFVTSGRATRRCGRDARSVLEASVRFLLHHWRAAFSFRDGRDRRLQRHSLKAIYANRFANALERPVLSEPLVEPCRHLRTEAAAGN